MSDIANPIPSFRIPLLALAGSLLADGPALAQTAPAGVTDLGRIEIRSNRDNDTEARRESTASKIVIGREDIEKQGDATLGELLKRLPGVTMGGPPGRGGAIRMRGLGNGYTQILLDGERMPPGFSVDQLTPEQVERIEILRAPTAETGARAIAGTINIVLREGRRGAPDDLKLTTSSEHGHTSGQVNWVHNLMSEALGGSFTLSAMDTYRPDQSTTVTDFSPDDEYRPDRVREVSSLGRRRAVNANARLQWKGEEGRSLILMPFLVYSEYSSQGRIGVHSTSGDPLFSDSSATRSDSRFVMARLNGQWSQRLSADDRLEWRFGLGRSNYDYRMDQTGASEVGPLQSDGETVRPLLRNGFETQNFTDNSHNLTGKWTRVLDGGHQIVSGIEYEQVRREEDGNAAVADEAGRLQAGTRRWALYSQDEFRIDPQWSAYGGLRYEAVSTEGTVYTDGVPQLKHNQSGVWTPLIHAVFKPDPQKRDQIRMGLTRSYKTPTLYQLVARYVPSLGDNTWTQPDRTGNPDLRPELATGVDLAFERYLEQGGVLSTNLFRRNISNLIRYTTTFNGTRYVSSPSNVGDAITQGVELEAKFRLNQWLAEAWPIDVRSNVSFFQSRVKDVPGPNNRLDQQPPSTGNLGGDYRLRSLPLTVGGNFNWNPSYDTRRTVEQSAYQGAKRVLDVYGLWRLFASAGLRLTVSNLTPMAYVTGSTFSAGGQTEAARTTARNWQNVQLRLELRI
ncbi:MAG: TonB-dependent receptor plug domain-containing protein [Limnohabitans sp.]